MIKNIRPTGIVIYDLAKMLAFYHQLGFVDESRAVEKRGGSHHLGSKCRILGVLLSLCILI